MEEKEMLVANITDKATKEAKAKKLNEAQTKLYIDEEIKKALEEYETKMQNNKTAIQATQATKEKTTIENKATVKKETKKYVVYTPVQNFCGEVAGVQFAYGKAEVKPGWILNWFKEKGYRIEEVSE